MHADEVLLFPNGMLRVLRGPNVQAVLCSWREEQVAPDVQVVRRHTREGNAMSLRTFLVAATTNASQHRVERVGERNLTKQDDAWTEELLSSADFQ